MSSKPRHIIPGAFYQVCACGVAKLDMFRHTEFRTLFLNILKTYLSKYGFECYAFSFTVNQYDLVLRSSKEHTISEFMRIFNSVVAKVYNKHYQRDGTVFARRYDSLIPCDLKRLIELIRFVHLQPVRAQECTLEHLDKYEWCSHSLVLNNFQKPIFDSLNILDLFEKLKYPKNYREFIADGWPDSDDDEIVCNVVGALQGKRGFREWKLSIIGEPDKVKELLFIDLCQRVRLARFVKENLDLKVIENKVGELMCMSGNFLRINGIRNEWSTARELFAYVARHRYDFANASIAKYMNVDESTVSKIIKRFTSVDEGEYLVNEICCAISGNG